MAKTFTSTGVQCELLAPPPAADSNELGQIEDLDDPMDLDYVPECESEDEDMINESDDE